MQHMYRGIVLIGLLIGLIVNAVATYQLKSDISHLDGRLSEVQRTLTSSETRMQTSVATIKESIVTQLAEHERLISQLENMVNYNLDN